MDHLMMAYLDNFTLDRHGDYWEKKWWPIIKVDFPSYEVFWRYYVVPLTNRIDSSISRSGPDWIRVRKSVPDRYLQMMMAHYSVFYRLGRASEMAGQTHLDYAEDVIDLLQTAGENFVYFLKKLTDIAADANTRFTLASPDQFPKGFDLVFREIKDYRDTLLHYPVLGRAVHVGREYLPIHTKLDHVKELWRNAETLQEGELVESTALVARLCQGCKSALEHIWTELLTSLTNSTLWEKMATTTAVCSVSLGDAAVVDRNPFYSPAASGTFIHPQKP